jgi:hypothetical protein
VERRCRLIRNVQFDQPGLVVLGGTEDEHANDEGQAVSGSQADGLGGVAAGEGQRGRAGVHGQALDEFEADLESSLYKIWNRMSSGTWFPPPVRAVEIPKPQGDGVRVLGVPTIADRSFAAGFAAGAAAGLAALIVEDDQGSRIALTA